MCASLKKLAFLNDNTWQTHVWLPKKNNYLNVFYWLNVNWFMSGAVTTIDLAHAVLLL